MKGNFTILYGDIVGLGQLYDSVENTDDFKNRHKSTIYSLADRYDGILLEHFTDSTKIIFKNPANAIRFATELFNNFSLEPRIPYRIGISYGLVEYDNNGIYGMPAQVAAHLIAICTEGAVLLSKKVLNQIEKTDKFQIKYIGQSYLKGNNSPVQVHCLADDNLYVPSPAELIEKDRRKKSIAVLPFHNTSSEKALDYICDGLAEEVIDNLTKAKDIFVTARSSSFLFKNSEASILEISRKLNVNFVLEGSIRKRNDMYRISYQLVDCSSGYNVLSDTRNASFEKLYDSEKEISNAIVRYFNIDETSEDIIKDDYYIDPTAYSCYLQGKYLSTSWEFESVKKSIEYFNKALQIVPNYALAFAGLSFSYARMAIYRFADFKKSLLKALEYADKSIAADNTIPDGFISKAIATFWMGNWYVPDFEKNVTSALAISPCKAEIRMYSGMLFLMKGELKRSLSELLLAKQLDPSSQEINIRLGLSQHLNQEYGDALNTFLFLLNTQPNKSYYIQRMAVCYIHLEQYHKALDILPQITNDYEFYNITYGIYLVIYKALKDDLKFFEIKSIIEQLPKEDTCTYYNLAILNKLLGKSDQSIEYLSKVLQNPLFLSNFMQYDKFWEEYHNHPRFQELITSKYKGTGNQFIKIESDTKEFIEVKLADFLYAEAQDNYTLFVYNKDNKRVERILRVTLANAEDQLKEFEIIRCHRSYLVNHSLQWQFSKSGNNAFLKLPEFDINVPVSRSKEKEMKTILNDK
ncbi:LytTR family transcriptional regulator DNA-binding domain-containing protein [Mariniphaga sediminis]|uniref:LytTR family transcriptional regulator DNA-binding domain-containing protein n=1 Tax=Mariniphaga sediminis TaxID=1628158 RepID=UPI0035614D8B